MAPADEFDQRDEWISDPAAAARFRKPEHIRAALLPDHAVTFDAVLANNPDYIELRAWRRIAWLTELDPDDVRRAFAAVDEIARFVQNPPEAFPKPGSPT